jgi:hypothetical protein
VVLSVCNFLVGNRRTVRGRVVVVRWLLVDNVRWLLVDNVRWLLVDNVRWLLVDNVRWLLVVHIHDVSVLGLAVMRSVIDLMLSL